LPNLNKHVIGVRYTYKNLFAETRSLNDELDGMRTDEKVNTMEVFGRFNLHKQVQLSVFLPFSYIHEVSTISDHKKGGLGDMTFLLQYSVLDPLKCNGKQSKHQLRLGAGTKLPSGQFEQNASNLYNTSVQLGTGSFDFIFNTIYTYRYKKFGLNATAAYKLNTVNPQRYRFGNKVDGGANVFYVTEWKGVKFMPSLGVTYSHVFENYHNGLEVYASSSDIILSSISMDVYYKHVAFNISALPVVYNRTPVRDFKQVYSIETGLFYNF
jgi:hypothetical protein